ESATGEWQDIASYVPAPSAMALLGLAGLAGRRRREG
ncbi:MAG: PEP-CTERM sorting domain-containing protein, partial [Phycisphaeraceae bacterium]|nr:PEP-CTERM sorting domain-containing protein [Phycisphaeraceae bacterium]